MIHLATSLLHSVVSAQNLVYFGGEIQHIPAARFRGNFIDTRSQSWGAIYIKFRKDRSNHALIQGRFLILLDSLFCIETTTSERPNFAIPP